VLQFGNGALQFQTLSGLTAGSTYSFAPQLSLASSGNLGLGVTPSAWSGNWRALQSLSGGAVAFDAFATTYLTSNSYVDAVGWKYFATRPSGQYRIDNNIHQWFNAPSGTAGNAISFTQAMTLDASGRLGVGTTTTSNARVTSVGVADNYPAFRAETSATTSQQQISFVNPNGVVGTITTDGSTTSYNTSSDYRLKNITGPITTSGAYIDSLNPVEGTWKADGSTFVGLIAHEVQEASRTNVATGVKDGEQMQGMDYSSAEIIANLIAEVKALRTRVAALESI
jgi:hypothetical protein